MHFNPKGYSVGEGFIMDLNKLASIFDKGGEIKSEVEEARKEHRKFLKVFPFRNKPEKIDELRPEDLYNPGIGTKDYFFWWMEYGLSKLGRIFPFVADAYENAVERIEVFKELLRIAVDDSKSLAEKIDADWDKIKRFGGDRHIAKKIISTYYPQEVIPIFKTQDLEHFSKELELGVEGKALDQFDLPYDALSIGEKYQLFNDLLLDIKKEFEKTREWDNAYFMWFLYETYPPQRRPPSYRGVTAPLVPPGMIFEPENELGVVCLFGAKHEELGFPFIIKIGSRFPDATVVDEEGDTKTVEFEYRSSDFERHGHPPQECDIIVCWVDDWTDAPRNTRSKILSLKSKFKE